jgi:Pregnancy-associated plasma protein-A
MPASATDVPVVRRCGTMPVHRRLLNEDPSYVAARDAIETTAYQHELGVRRALRRGIIRISVVVHVVFRDAAQNISQAQIDSQIDVLNQDYRRRNPDAVQIPEVWRAFAADARIEFHLATEDPMGNPTPGVTRTQTAASSFGTDDAVKFTARGGIDAWPTDRYLNIWVCKLAGGLLGYAQFPGGPAATDGVVITHTGFGTTGTATAPFNLGRSATHEIGHWLNLFHIWGDDGTGCGGSDMVADTPNQAGPNYGVPTFPSGSCGNGPVRRHVHELHGLRRRCLHGDVHGRPGDTDGRSA